MPLRVLLNVSLLVAGSLILFGAEPGVAQQQSPVLTSNVKKPVAVPATATPGHHQAQKISSSEIAHFYKVTDRLYRGGQPSDKGFEELKKLGITHIISLRSGSDDAKIQNDETLTFEHIPVSVNPFKKPKEADVIQFLKAVTTTSNHPVFVHCREGVDRTGLMIAAYRIVIDEWSREEAITEMNSIGSHWYYQRFESYLRKLDVEKIKKQINQ